MHRFRCLTGRGVVPFLYVEQFVGREKRKVITILQPSHSVSAIIDYKFLHFNHERCLSDILSWAIKYFHISSSYIVRTQCTAVFIWVLFVSFL